MTRYTLTVPLADNDGTPLPTLHDFLRTRGLAPFGAWTELSVTGAWNGEHAGRENHVLYVIDTEREDALPILRALALCVKRDAAQDAVYLTAQPIQTYLI